MPTPPLFDRESEHTSSPGGSPAPLPPVTPQEVREEVAFTKRMVDRVLLHGPNTRFRELSLLMGVVRDFLTGFRSLHFVGPCVTVFGSARFPEDHPYYLMARDMGAAIASLGFTVMTGGGPGIMEAANLGAVEGGGKSVGLGIELPMEQSLNAHVQIGMEFDYFFIRKMMFTKFAAGLVVAPGGFGTMDELFDTLTLIQTRKIRRIPVVMLGTSYFGPLVSWMQDVLLQEGAISKSDLDLWLLTDEPAAAAAYLDRHIVDQTWWSQPMP